MPNRLPAAIADFFLFRNLYYLFTYIYPFHSCVTSLLFLRRMKIGEEKRKKNKLLHKQVQFFAGVSFRFLHLFVSSDARITPTKNTNFVSVLRVEIMAKLLWPLHSDIMMISRLEASAVCARAHTHTLRPLQPTNKPVAISNLKHMMEYKMK